MLQHEEPFCGLHHMSQADLALPLASGLIASFFMFLGMRRGHVLPAALNWCRGMPDPAILPRTFVHPKYGRILGHRVMYCESVQEIVAMITDRAPSSWREAPRPRGREEMS